MKGFNDPPSDWERFGEREPYWAVLTEDKFRGSKINPQTRREFFQSGEAHLDSVTETIRKTLDAGFSPQRALDFGCGVGRVLIPLARHYPDAVGIDVAKSMLREAQRNLVEGGVGAQLVLGDDALTRLSGAFDFIHSYIVFQHIPPARGLRITATLLDRLEPGGVAALHYSYASPLSPRQRFLRWARQRTSVVAAAGNLAKGRPASSPYMETYEYDLARVFETFHRAGCSALHLRLTDHGGLLGVFIFCRKNGDANKPAASPST